MPKQDLNAAVAANSVGVNVSRAVGPALGGIMVAQIGITAPFWFNAFSNAAVIGALFWWHSPRGRDQRLPVERFFSSIRTGFRYARYKPQLRATLIRAVSFFLFASAYWALLALVTRTQIAGGPDLYGYLLGAIGASAVGGGLALPWLKGKLGANRLVAVGTLGTAVAMLLFGLARDAVTALLASLIAGVSWIAVIAVLNVSAQLALPEWVRGRGLAIFVTTFFGALSLGSAIWGQLAGLTGLPPALFVAAAGAIATIPLTWHWKLQTAAGMDLTSSMHWPTPVLSHDIEQDRGPVLVTVEYRIRSQDREAFLSTLEKSAASGAETATIGGASTRIAPRKDAFSKYSWWHPGWSTYVSTSALQTPIVYRRRRFSAFSWPASQKSHTSSRSSRSARRAWMVLPADTAGFGISAHVIAE